MDRSLRRHQQAVARVRKLNILRQHWSHPERVWRQLNRMCMNEPGHWVRDMMTRPARRVSNHLEHLVERGVEDHWRWPDNRKPHQYYW